MRSWSTARSVPTDDVDENKLWTVDGHAECTVLGGQITVLWAGGVSGNLLSVDAGRSFNFG